MILLPAITWVMLTKELAGPATDGLSLMVAAAARIKSFAFVVTAIGVVGVVLTPVVLGGTTSTAFDGATPENSLTFSPTQIKLLAKLTVIEEPEPELFRPYQISPTEWLPL